MSAETTIPDAVIPAQAGTHSDALSRRQSRESGNPVSFVGYPKYKDSGVQWLGDVPTHWEVVPIKQLARLKGGSGFPHEEQGNPNEALYFYKVAALANARPDGTLAPSEDTVSRETADRLGAQVFPPKSIVFAKVGAALLLGRVRALATEGCIDNNMMGAVVNDLNDVAFFAHALSLVKFDLIANPGAVPSLNVEQIGSYLLPRPPEREQVTIAAFLDRETTKIDALIAEQEKLVALLKEKRQALISHAVTKGLEPNAPMKDSGIEWLGQVPAHWGVSPMYLRYSILLGKMLDTGKLTGEASMSYLRNVDVQWDAINTQDLPEMDIAPEERERFTVRNGDLLVCEGGEVGRAAIVSGLTLQTGYQKALHRLRSASAAEAPRFMFYVFRWATSVGAFAGEGQSTIAHLTGEQLRKYRFPQPPLAEQNAIAIYLDDQVRGSDALVAEAGNAIELLRERRSALISAAVTGKICVLDP